MDAVFGVLVMIVILSVLAIIIMLYNRIRWKDELHGLFEPKQKDEREDA